MYNFIKLLTEEPEKLERMFIALIKLLITLFIVNSLFKFDIHILDLFDKKNTKSISIPQILSFIVSVVFVWEIIWNIIGKIIIEEIIISLLSKIGKSKRKKIFHAILKYSRIIKVNKNKVELNRNTIEFNDFLQSYANVYKEVISKNKSQIILYLIISIVLYIFLFFFDNIRCINCLKFVMLFVIINWLISSVLLKIVEDYISENLEELKKEFSSLAYTQLLINAIESNLFIAANYARSMERTQIFLKRVNDNKGIPKYITFHSVNYWNELLVIEMLSTGLENWVYKNARNNRTDDNNYDVMVSNIELNDKQKGLIRSKPGLVFMHCINEEQFYKNIEVLFFKISNKRYYVD